MTDINKQIRGLSPLNCSTFQRMAIEKGPDLTLKTVIKSDFFSLFRREPELLLEEVKALLSNANAHSKELSWASRSKIGCLFYKSQYFQKNLDLSKYPQLLETLIESGDFEPEDMYLDQATINAFNTYKNQRLETQLRLFEKEGSKADPYQLLLLGKTLVKFDLQDKLKNYPNVMHSLVMSGQFSVSQLISNKDLFLSYVGFLKNEELAHKIESKTDYRISSFLPYSTDPTTPQPLNELIDMSKKYLKVSELKEFNFLCFGVNLTAKLDTFLSNPALYANHQNSPAAQQDLNRIKSEWQEIVHAAAYAKVSITPELLTISLKDKINHQLTFSTHNLSQIDEPKLTALFFKPIVESCSLGTGKFDEVAFGWWMDRLGTIDFSEIRDFKVDLFIDDTDIAKLNDFFERQHVKATITFWSPSSDFLEDLNKKIQKGNDLKNYKSELTVSDETLLALIDKMLTRLSNYYTVNPQELETIKPYRDIVEKIVRQQTSQLLNTMPSSNTMNFTENWKKLLRISQRLNVNFEAIVFAEFRSYLNSDQISQTYKENAAGLAIKIANQLQESDLALHVNPKNKNEQREDATNYTYLLGVLVNFVQKIHFQNERGFTELNLRAFANCWKRETLERVKKEPIGMLVPSLLPLTASQEKVDSPKLPSEQEQSELFALFNEPEKFVVEWIKLKKKHPQYRLNIDLASKSPALKIEEHYSTTVDDLRTTTRDQLAIKKILNRNRYAHDWDVIAGNLRKICRLTNDCELCNFTKNIWKTHLDPISDMCSELFK